MPSSKHRGKSSTMSTQQLHSAAKAVLQRRSSGQEQTSADSQEGGDPAQQLSPTPQKPLPQQVAQNMPGLVQPLAQANPGLPQAPATLPV